MANWVSAGCGVIANELAQAMEKRGKKLYGVVNRTQEKAVAFAKKYGVQNVFTSFEEVCADPAVDIIYISTPHNTHIQFLRKALAAGKHVLCEKSITLNSEELEEAMQLAKEHGVRVILNTAPCQPLSDEFLSGVYLVTPNEVEAETLTGIAVKDQQSADRAAQVLFAKGVQNVLITLGSRGVYLNTAGRSEIIPAYRVEAVDTTGAGDAFNGGLLTALSEGKSLREAARFGNALAALSVQRMGAAPSMPTRAEIEAFLAAHGA